MGISVIVGQARCRQQLLRVIKLSAGIMPEVAESSLQPTEKIRMLLLPSAIRCQWKQLRQRIILSYLQQCAIGQRSGRFTNSKTRMSNSIHQNDVSISPCQNCSQNAAAGTGPENEEVALMCRQRFFPALM